MGRKLELDELKAILRDIVKNEMPLDKAAKKYDLALETTERVARYGGAGYELATEKKKVCQKCGEPMEEKMQFCWKCGTKAAPGEKEILEMADRLIKILATFPSSSSNIGISIVEDKKQCNL